MKQSVNNQIVSSETKPIIKYEGNGSWCNLCPSFKVEVFSDRTVKIKREFYKADPPDSMDFVKKKLVTNKKLSVSQFADLKKQFDNVNYFDLSDKYFYGANCPESLSDSPTFHFLYNNNNQSKTVDYYSGCKGSDELKRIAQLQEYLSEFFDTSAFLEGGINANINISTIK